MMGAKLCAQREVPHLVPVEVLNRSLEPGNGLTQLDVHLMNQIHSFALVVVAL